MNRFALLFRIVLSGLFIVAGALKISEPAQFAADLDRFRILPYAATLPLALFLPWLEVGSGLALLAGPARRGALVVLTLLCAVFAAAIASALVRKLDIVCGCFGSTFSAGLAVSLLRALLLLAAAGWLLRRELRGGP
jgi:putative oxidoreductase